MNEQLTVYAMIGLLIVSVKINTCINDMQRIKDLEREISLYKKSVATFCDEITGDNDTSIS